MGTALDYGRQGAPQDVLGSLDWLALEGFVPVAERGGPGESFGNLLVEFERPPLAVRVTRDKGQWLIDVAPVHGEFIPLHVLITAREGSTPAPMDRQAGDPLPEVLPEGVQWRVVLPAVLSWLEAGDRTREIGEARAAWKAAMTRYWAKQRRRA